MNDSIDFITSLRNIIINDKSRIIIRTFVSIMILAQILQILDVPTSNFIPSLKSFLPLTNFFAVFPIFFFSFIFVIFLSLPVTLRFLRVHKKEYYDKPEAQQVAYFLAIILTLLMIFFNQIFAHLTAIIGSILFLIIDFFGEDKPQST